MTRLIGYDGIFTQGSPGKNVAFLIKDRELLSVSLAFYFFVK